MALPHFVHFAGRMAKALMYQQVDDRSESCAQAESSFFA